MPILRINTRISSFADVVQGQMTEPIQNYVDWERSVTGSPVKEVVSLKKVVLPGQTLSLASVPFVSGVETGALYNFYPHPSVNNRYQLRYVSGGASDPLVGLGTGLSVSANTYSVTINTDGTINLVNNGPSFVDFARIAGDIVYLSGSNFGDTGVFNILNQGFWVVVSCSAVGVNSGAKLVLKRLNLSDSTGYVENVTASGTYNIQYIPPQSACFINSTATSYNGIWQITESASGWISVDSINPLPYNLNVTVSSFSIVSSDFISYARIEADDTCLVQLTSGDLSPPGYCVLNPVSNALYPAGPLPGWFESYGMFTSASITNIMSSPLNVNGIIGFSSF